jgi:hypothetical protein
MKKNILLTISLVLAALFLGQLITSVKNTSAQTVVKVEYRIIQLRGNSIDQIQGEFNKMGAEGWQLVEWGRQPTAVFKR